MLDTGMLVQCMTIIASVSKCAMPIVFNRKHMVEHLLASIVEEMIRWVVRYGLIVFVSQEEIVYYVEILRCELKQLHAYEFLRCMCRGRQRTDNSNR